MSTHSSQLAVSQICFLLGRAAALFTQKQYGL